MNTANQVQMLLDTIVKGRQVILLDGSKVSVLTIDMLPLVSKIKQGFQEIMDGDKLRSIINSFSDTLTLKKNKENNKSNVRNEKTTNQIDFLLFTLCDDDSKDYNKFMRIRKELSMAKQAKCYLSKLEDKNIDELSYAANFFGYTLI